MRSPAANVAVCVVSLQDVADAPEIVQVTDVDEPFLRKVKTIDSPVPGALLNCT